MGELMCRIDYADDSGVYLRGGTRHARKDHKCGDCGRLVAKGEDYHYAVFVYDGHLDQYVMCAHCWAASAWLQKVCGGWCWEGVIEELDEHWREEHQLRSVGLGRLVVCGERQWRRSRRLRSDALVPVEDVRRWCTEALARVPEDAFA